MKTGRRSFLHGLLALPFLVIPARSTASRPVHYDLNHFPVAGIQYYAGPARIEHQGVKLGYVPRTDTISADCCDRGQN